MPDEENKQAGAQPVAPEDIAYGAYTIRPRTDGLYEVYKDGQKINGNVTTEDEAIGLAILHEAATAKPSSSQASQPAPETPNKGPD